MKDDLLERLKECRTGYDEKIMADHAETIGCDCGLLREAGDEIERLHRSRAFYMRRCEALQAVQGKMRDPERKAVCDVLANGKTYAALGQADRSHQYVQSKEHGGCSMCGYPEWEPWHEPRVRR